eukprot:5563876-Prymnesium_polylepis.1
MGESVPRAQTARGFGSTHRWRNDSTVPLPPPGSPGVIEQPGSAFFSGSETGPRFLSVGRAAYERTMTMDLPNRPPSATPSHDWSRPATFARNNFPEWSPGHPLSKSGRLTARPLNYKPSASVFSALGDSVPTAPAGTRHVKWEALDGTSPHSTRGISAPFATWRTSNSAYGQAVPPRNHRCEG